uniref:Coiled-coil domain containing 42 n=1 Tax=Apteryx owenii TaxID=8824 RepID=A0A8B9QDP5_APTOW
GAVAAMDNEDLSEYFCMHYKKNLLPLLTVQMTSSQLSSHVMFSLHCQAFKVRMEAINCRWRDLQGKEAQLKAYTQKFEKFIQENDKKRIRALKKASKEREMKMQREKELLRARRELEALKDKHQKIYSALQKYSIFNKYLEDVVKVSEESHWAHIQNTAAEKTLLLGTIKMATLNLFQCVSKQLKKSLNVPVEDTHRQLDMVEAGQPPSPCPAKGAVMSLSSWFLTHWPSRRKGHLEVTSVEDHGLGTGTERCRGMLTETRRLEKRWSKGKWDAFPCL